MKPYIEFDTDDGKATYAKTALNGLVLWYGDSCPQPDTSRLESLEIHIQEDTIEMDDPLFLPFVVGTCERTWNKSPEITTGDTEEAALQVLKFLRKYGNLMRLVINGEEYDPV